MCSSQPLSAKDLYMMFDQGVGMDLIKAMLADLQKSWHGRGIELVEVGSGWRFPNQSGTATSLERLIPGKPPKYSVAMLETLAIIAYKQPVTRSIEEIRGVTINSLLIKQLEDRGWIEVVGQRDTGAASPVRHHPPVSG